MRPVQRRLLLLVPLALAAYAIPIAWSQIVNGDPAYYIGLARSLSSGQGYLFNGQPHVHYPPGFPLLLAPVVALFGPSVAAAQVVVAALAIVAVLMVWFWARARGDVSPALAATLFGFSGAWFALATADVRSEPAYVVVTLGALLLIETWPERPSLWRLLRAPLAAYLILAAVLMRSVGIALPAAVFATAVVRAWRRESATGPRPVTLAVVALPAAVFFVAWSLWVLQQQSGGPSYFDLITLGDAREIDVPRAGLGGIALRVLVNLRAQLSHTAELLGNIGWAQPRWFSPLAWAAALAVGAGWVREFRRENPLAAWYALAYAGVVLLWPFSEERRFILPLLPLLLVFAIRGAPALVRFVGSLRPRTLALAAAGVGVVSVAGLYLELRSGTYGRQDGAFGLFWAALAVGGLVAAFRPAFVAPLSSHRSATILFTLWTVGYVAAGAVSIVRTAGANVAGTRVTSGSSIREVLPVVESLPDDAVIMTDFASGVHFYTGRPTIELPKTASPDELLAWVEARTPNYVLGIEHGFYLPRTSERIDSLRSALHGGLVLVVTLPSGPIYEVAETH